MSYYRMTIAVRPSPTTISNPMVLLKKRLKRTPCLLQISLDTVRFYLGYCIDCIGRISSFLLVETFSLELLTVPSSRPACSLSDILNETELSERRKLVKYYIVSHYK